MALKSLNAETAAEFFAEYYGTQNRITAIIGDIDPTTLIPLLEKTCGRAPKGPSRQKRTAPAEEQKGQRRVNVDFPANPLLAMAWHTPGINDPFSPALELVIRILAQGGGSRLEQRLVRDEGCASRILADTGWPGRRDASLAVIIAVPTSETELSKLEAAVLEEAARLAETGPTDTELEAAKVTARAELLRSMQNPAELASVLLEFEAKTGDWREAFRRMHKLEAVDAEDVKRVLDRWFTTNNMTVATLATPTEESTKE